MAFPTIPTVASGDLLSSTTSPASTTHTFPSLSSLRGGAGPQAGDLLIAICVQYGAATAGNQYSSWGASFTEILDDSLSSGTGVGALGIATKTATGSESGTFSVTSVTSSKSVQFLIRIPAGTWLATEIQAATRATGAVSDPASFDPAGWDAADTLWISVAGQTETSTTGSPPTLDSPPSGYSGQLIVARVADAVGDITAGVAFRQVNASAEDVGTWTATNANRGNGIATVIAIRPVLATLFGQIAFPITFVESVSGIIQPQTTSVAEISLASHGTPSEQTNHSIIIRARTTSGSTGVIKAALYEGATNRSGDLTSSALTNSLANYTLSIPDANAANITDYSNLSIKIWGYAPNGGSLVFEVANIYLELPEAGVTTHYGVTSQVTTFSKAVSGFKQTFGQIATPFTFTRVVSGTRKTFGQVVAPFTFVKAVTGRLQMLGQVSRSFTFVKSVVATKTTFGQIVRSFTFVKDIAFRRTTFGQTATPITFTKAVSGIRKTFSQIVAPFTFTKNVSGAKTALGQIAASFTFVKSVIGKRTTFGQIVTGFTFARAISGVRTTLSQIVTPFIFNKAVSGKRTTFSRVDLPLIFTDQTSGRKQTFGNVVFPINFTFDVVAETQGIRYGQTSMSLIFEKEVAGSKKTFGQITSPYLFARSIQAFRTAFGRFDFPFEFVKEIIGRRETFGNLTFPMNVSFIVAGRRLSYGQIALSLVFGEQTSGHRKTFGQIATSYLLETELQGTLETFGSTAFPIDFVVDVDTGRVETFSSLGLEFLLSIETAGMIRPTGIILNLAKALYLGSTSVDAVYTGSQKVWP